MTTPPGEKTGRPTDSMLLALIHVEAASVADVNGARWVQHVRRVGADRVELHTVVTIEVPTLADQEAVTGHLFGTAHPVGHWRLNHVGVTSEDAGRVTVLVTVGGAS